MNTTLSETTAETAPSDHKMERATIERLIEGRKLIQHVSDNRFQLFDHRIGLAGLFRRAEQILGIHRA